MDDKDFIFNYMLFVIVVLFAIVFYQIYEIKRNVTHNYRFVSQGKNTKKCGQAVLSMITGLPLEEVCETLGEESTYLTKDLKPYLESLGYVCKTYSTTKYEEIPPNSIVFSMNPMKDRYGHYSLKVDYNTYFDPTIGIIKDYNTDVKVPTHYLHFKLK